MIEVRVAPVENGYITTVMGKTYVDETIDDVLSRVRDILMNPPAQQGFGIYTNERGL